MARVLLSSFSHTVGDVNVLAWVGHWLREAGHEVAWLALPSSPQGNVRARIEGLGINLLPPPDVGLPDVLQGELWTAGLLDPPLFWERVSLLISWWPAF